MAAPRKRRGGQAVDELEPDDTGQDQEQPGTAMTVAVNGAQPLPGSLFTYAPIVLSEVRTADAVARGMTTPEDWLPPDLLTAARLATEEAGGRRDRVEPYIGGYRPRQEGERSPWLIVPVEADFTRHGIAHEYLPSADLATLGAGLIGRHDRTLPNARRARILYCWRRTGGMSKGEPRLAGIVKCNALVTMLSGADFIVWLAADNCFMFTQHALEATLHHQLMYVAVDDQGRPMTRQPDLVLFIDELRELGITNPKLGQVYQTMKQLQLPAALEPPPTPDIEDIV